MSSNVEVGTRRPYPGLRPFERYEADIFFGRKRHVTDLLSRLKSQRFLGVVGPSGCGKSSLIRAGLIPALEAGFMARSQCLWNFAILRPGNQPLLHLAEALWDSGVFGESDCDKASAVAQMKQDLEACSRSLADRLLVNENAQDRNLLILVDQFEELFRFEREQGGDESRAFVNLLLETARDSNVSAYVVLTMRTDFLGQCPVFTGLPEALNESQYLTPRLTREQTEAAIVGPARMFEGDVEPDVIARILNEMGTAPDQLPLMQHLLMRMWRSAQQRADLKTGASEASILGGSSLTVEQADVCMTMADYNESGGLRHALGQHAQGVFDCRLSPQQQKLAEQMFRQLTDVSPNGQLIRRSPAPTFGELCNSLNDQEQEELGEVIDIFRAEGRSYLMPPPCEPLHVDTPIDISHESLIRNWPALHKWTHEEAQAAQIRDEIAEDAAAWHAGGRKPSDTTIPESRLATALEWAEHRPHAVTPLVREFLDACVRRKQREQTARWRSWGATGIAVILALLTWFVYSQQQRTARALSDSFWREAVRKLDVGSQGDVAAALVWTAEAYDHEPRLWSVSNDRKQLYAMRRDAILAQHPRLETLRSHPGQIVKDASPDGNYLVTAAANGWNDLQILDSRDSTKESQTLGRQNASQLAQFSNDGKYLLAVLASREQADLEQSPLGNLAVWRWPPPEGQSPQRLEPPTASSGNVRAAQFVPVDTSSQTSEPAVVAIVQEQTNERPYTVMKIWRSLSEPPEEWKMPGVSRRDTAAGNTEVPGSSPTSLTVSPDGSFLATWGALDNTQCAAICIWDVKQGELVVCDVGATSTVVTAAFSTNGQWLVALDNVGRAHLWRPAEGKRLLTWDAHVGTGQKVLFGAVEDWVLTVGADNVARVWQIPSYDTLQEEGKSAKHSTPTAKVALPHESDIYDAAFSPDGYMVATAGRDRIARVWSVATGQLAIPPLHHASGVDRVRFTAPRELQTTAVFNSYTWRLDASNPPAVSLDVANDVSPVDTGKLFSAQSESGSYAITAATNATGVHLQVWDVSDHCRRRGPLLHHNDARAISYAAVSDNGRCVLTVVADGQERPQQSAHLWDVDRGTSVLLWQKQPATRCQAAFSPDAKLVLIAKESTLSDVTRSKAQLQVWNDQGESLFTVDDQQRGSVNHIAWSPAGDRVVICSGTNANSEKQGAAQLWIWNGKQAQLKSAQVWQHRPPADEVTSNAVLFAAFSPDGKRVATGGVDNAAYLWDVSSDEALSPALKHTSDIVHVAFSHDGKRLATCSIADKTTRVWTVRSLMRQGRGSTPASEFTLVHSGAVNRATFSPDNKWLATASSDQTARVWSLTIGELAAQFQHGGNVKRVRFSEDGRRLVTVSDSGINRINPIANDKSWPKCSLWILTPPNETPSLSNIQDYARLLAASQPNEGATVIQMLGLTPEQADERYSQLWNQYKNALLPEVTQDAAGKVIVKTSAEQ